MSKIRCLVCGSSQLDPEGYKCGRCGKAIGLREEACCVSEETKKKLLDHADELFAFGIRLEQSENLQKNANTVLEVVGLVIACADSFNHGVLRKLVCYLRDKLFLTEEEILRLRLDEPEQILTYYRMDKKQERGA